MRAVIFWVSAALVLYTFAVYPLLLIALAAISQMLRDLKFAARRHNRRIGRARGRADVSILICAHNEQDVIAARLDNCAALDYSAGSVEILLGCDGCSDSTARIAMQAGVPGLRVFEFPRAGKAETLNRLMPMARGDIVVFSDANTEFDRCAVSALVRHFEDPAVGCVCGELRLRPGPGGAQAEGLYWRYETVLKFFESRLNLLPGANGGIFAIRRELYEPLPAGTIVDDFAIAMRIRARGRRVVYDPEAAAFEDVSGPRQEFHRRVRIGAGNVHVLTRTWRMLSPTAGGIAFSYWSHKVLRWIAPAAMAAALVSALSLCRELPYAIAAALGVGAVAMGTAGYMASRRGVRGGVCTALFYFLAMNAALLAGAMAYIFGRRYTAWAPTARARGPHGAGAAGAAQMAAGR